MFTPVPMTLPPGVVRNGTRYAQEGRWYATNMVRFVDGAPERWGGWERISDSTLGLPARGAIGPTEGKDWVQNIKGTLGFGKSYDINQKIKSAQKNLQLIMTRLMMSGQGNISEGERQIVNEAIGALETSVDQKSFLDNVRYTRELMGGIFGMDVPSKYSVPSSMQDRVANALTQAQEVNKQNADNTASDGTKLYRPENAQVPRDESRRFNPRGAPSASSIVMPPAPQAQPVGSIRTTADGRKFKKTEDGWQPLSEVQ